MTRINAPVRALTVALCIEDGTHVVGRLAWRDRRAYFQYDTSFLRKGLDLSPVKLPLDPKLFEGPRQAFDGLHGLFSDSLPDGWGRLLMDRKLRALGIRPAEMTPLDRLAWIGKRGMGALTYEPERRGVADEPQQALDLDRLAEDAQLVLDDAADVVIDQLLQLGGSPQGARPKALIGLSADKSRVISGVEDLPQDMDHWLVKFRAPTDPIDVGAIEQAYAEMARAAGLDIPETTLLPSRKGPGYFAAKRFDRMGNKRVHMHTAAGLLDADPRSTVSGYEQLITLTGGLTRNAHDVEKIFARMVFNVLAFNRDDHLRNHSFLMDATGAWRLSPLYDVTYSDGPGGEHTLDIAGEGRHPTVEHMMHVARMASLPAGAASTVLERTRDALSGWRAYASNAGVSRRSSTIVSERLTLGSSS